MAWFWQRNKQKDQRAAQQEAQAKSAPKSGLLKRSKADAKASDKKATKAAPVKGAKAAKTISNARTYGILLGPVVTEKAARLAETGTFVFAVTPRANKIDVARAVASLYQVHPVNVQMVNQHGKPKTFGFRQGVRASARKAYVTLAKGEHIDFFESER